MESDITEAAGDAFAGDDADESRKWFTDPNISARAAAKIVTKRLHKYGPQSEFLMLVFHDRTSAYCSLAVHWHIDDRRPLHLDRGIIRICMQEFLI